MRSIWTWVSRRPFWKQETGQDLIEYGVLAAFLSVVALVTIRSIGPLVDAFYQNIVAALQ